MLRHKAASYAIAAMVELSQHSQNGGGGEVAANAIAHRYGLPVSYTAKILGQLARASLLRSDRGPRGGFALTRPPEEITLLDIFKAVGAVDDGRIPLASAIPAGVKSSIHEVLGRAMEGACEVFTRTSLADLLDQSPAAAGAH